MPAKKKLVFLPGSLCNDRVWRRQIDAFSKDYDISTPHFPEQTSLSEMALAALAEAPPSFSLVGFSMGGRIALEMMRFAPKRIERLALFDTSVHPVGPDEATKRQPLIDLARKDGMAALARHWLPRIVHPSRLTTRLIWRC